MLAALPLLLALAGAAQDPVPRVAPPPDSVPAVEVEPLVTVTRSADRLRRLPVAASVVESADLRGAGPSGGLSEVLDAVPGVHVANRYNFSLDQRLSIRGFGSRSNFGARGIRILLDGVPQTLPDGQSQLSNVDFGDLGRIEILRGAASSLYGNASGGVISLQSAPISAGSFGQAVRVDGGAFGARRWMSRTTARSGRVAGAVSISRFTTDGFRDHSGADLRQLSATVEAGVAPGTTVTARFAAADHPRADNPGALTPAEYAARRDAAAPNNLARLAGKVVDQQQLSLRLHRVGAAGELGLTVYGLRRDLENPIATGTYIAVDRVAGGARLDLSRRLGSSPSAPRITGGVDVQAMRDDRTNRVADAGRPTDSIEVDQRERVRELGPFLQVQWPVSSLVLVEAGGRYDRVAFTVADRHLTDGFDDSGQRTLSAWSGHAGASLVLGAALIPYANVSTAFETPTTTELGNRPDGSGGFNEELGPQRAVTFELGARGMAGPIGYSAAGFVGRVRDAIVQSGEIGGRAFFRNAGRVRQDGIELGASARASSVATLRAAYTFAAFRFGEGDAGAADGVAGRRLPGVPRHFAQLALGLVPGAGVRVDVGHAVSSAVAADDANTVTVPGWGGGVTDVRVSWSASVGGVVLTPTAGINNLFDRAYVGAVTINGFGGRVIEPAPGRNGYLGLEVRYQAR